jgi:hypothetical protein
MGHQITKICCDYTPRQTDPIRSIQSLKPDLTSLYQRILKKLQSTTQKFSIQLETLKIAEELIKNEKVNDPHIENSQIKWIIELENSEKISIIYEKGVSKFVGKIDDDHNKINGVEIPKNSKKSAGTSNEKGIIYNGEFSNNQYHGYGIEYFSVNSFYEGEFQEGKREGRGRLILENGDIYEGNFISGLPDGKGTYTLVSKKLVYNGKVSKGIISGKGTLTFATGVKYKGDFSGGKMHGNGSLYLRNHGKLRVRTSQNTIEYEENN